MTMDSTSAIKPEVNSETRNTSILSIMQYCNYVHKLKRAWMQTSNDCNGEPKVKKATLSTARLETVQDFLIKLDIKQLMHLLKISIFSLNNDVVRLTKIMNNLVKDCKFHTFSHFSMS